MLQAVHCTGYLSQTHGNYRLEHNEYDNKWYFQKNFSRDYFAGIATDNISSSAYVRSVVIIVIVALAFFFEQLVHVDELELAFARLFAQIAQSPTYPNDANVITRIEPIEPRLKIEQRDVLALINVARQIAIKLVRRIKTLGYRIHDELHQNWVLVE